MGVERMERREGERRRGDVAGRAGGFCRLPRGMVHESWAGRLDGDEGAWDGWRCCYVGCWVQAHCEVLLAIINGRWFGLPVCQARTALIV